jgi:integrase
MSDVKFYLNNTKVEITTIYATIFKYGNRYKYPTGIAVQSKFWNPDKYRCRDRADYPDGRLINDQLDAWEDLIDQVLDNFSRELIIPSQSTFRTAVESKVELLTHKDPKVKKKLSFVEFAQGYKDSVERAERTLARYQTTINLVIEFQKSKNRILQFEDIDTTFYEAFKKWIYHSKDLSVNTFGDTIKNIKMFMNEAIEQGLTTTAGHKSKKFKTISEESDTISLSVDKLMRIHQTLVTVESVMELNRMISQKEGTKVDDNPHKIQLRMNALQDAKDRFLIGAFTALRFQDFNLLNGLTAETPLIRKRNQKTGKMTSIPMHPVIKEILKRRNNVLPEAISNAKMNKSIHLVCRLASLNELKEVSITKGGKRMFSMKPEWELVSSHTARRSACTNMYLAGVPITIIMTFSGHTKVAMFMKYIRIDDHEIAMKMMEHPFFN